MGLTIVFQYGLEQRVVTPFGRNGIVTMLGVDHSGNVYYIQTEQGGDWYQEKDLKPVHD